MRRVASGGSRVFGLVPGTRHPRVLLSEVSYSSSCFCLLCLFWDTEITGQIACRRIHDNLSFVLFLPAVFIDALGCESKRNRVGNRLLVSSCSSQKRCGSQARDGRVAVCEAENTEGRKKGQACTLSGEPTNFQS